MTEKYDPNKPELKRIIIDCPNGGIECAIYEALQHYQYTEGTMKTVNQDGKKLTALYIIIEDDNE